MICDQCGSENALDALFCMRCGSELAPHAASQVGSPQQSGWGLAAAGEVVDPATGQWVLAASTPGVLPFAEWWRRLVASILDGLIIMLWYVVVGIVATVLTWAVDPGGVEAFLDSWVKASTDPNHAGDSDWVMAQLDWPATGAIATFFVGMLVGAVISALYQILMTASPRFQGTLGKVIIRAKVTDVAGNRITRARATGRYFSKWIYGLSYLGTLLTIVSAITIASDDRKRALHDMMAGTLVLRRFDAAAVGPPPVADAVAPPPVADAVAPPPVADAVAPPPVADDNASA